MYDDQFRSFLLNQTARLVGIELPRLDITAEGEVVERSDGSGLIDVEIEFNELSEARSRVVSHIAHQIGGLAPELAKQAQLPISAAEAAERLVDLGRGRLSYELRVPIGKVELAGYQPNGEDEDDANGNSGGATMMAIVGTAAVVIAIIALNVACMVAVHNNHPLRKRRGASCQIEPSSVSSAGVELTDEIGDGGARGEEEDSATSGMRRPPGGSGGRKKKWSSVPGGRPPRSGLLRPGFPRSEEPIIEEIEADAELDEEL